MLVNVVHVWPQMVGGIRLLTIASLGDSTLVGNSFLIHTWHQGFSDTEIMQLKYLNLIMKKVYRAKGKIHFRTDHLKPQPMF